MNEQVILIAIGVLVAAVVLRPILRGRTGQGASARMRDLSAAGSEQLAELELDRSMGRVSAEDYTRFRDELESADSHAPSEGTAPDESLKRAEALVKRWHEAPRPSCAACGVRPEPEARYCSTCGATLGA